MIDIGPGQAPLPPDGCMSLAQVVGALPASLWTRPGMATFEQRARWVGVAAHVRGVRIGRDDRGEPVMIRPDAERFITQIRQEEQLLLASRRGRGPGRAAGTGQPRQMSAPWSSSLTRPCQRAGQPLAVWERNVGYPARACGLSVAGWRRR